MESRLLPVNWDAKVAGDRVMAGLVNLCPPVVKGAHDGDLVFRGGKAYVTYMANDVQPGEDPHWPYVYCNLAIVDPLTLRVERTETFAAGGKVYANRTLEPGACFVARILPKDESTLRLFFASEQPGVRQSQTWWLDFDLVKRAFDWNLHPATIETSLGKFPMQPKHFYDQAAAEGFAFPPVDYGVYFIDSFKQFGGRWHAVVNNFPIGQNAWAELNESLDGVRILGNFIQPTSDKLSEAAVNQLPDGNWLAIARCSNGDHNYRFARSEDGRTWSKAETWSEIPNGGSSKATLDRFGDVYYLGWQESTRFEGYDRSVFNVEVSRDGRMWERKYRFETTRSFQYPVFREWNGEIYLVVTQGNGQAFGSPENKAFISFGRLEPVPR